MRQFDISGLSVDRLLEDWRWLCPDKLTLVARNIFGDLFLADDSGSVWMLDIGPGNFERVADSIDEFQTVAATPAKREQWFHESNAQTAEERGLVPNDMQCIGFKMPIVFKESATYPDNAYMADLYEFVSVSGSIHKQISGVPDGAKVKLTVK